MQFCNFASHHSNLKQLDSLAFQQKLLIDWGYGVELVEELFVFDLLFVFDEKSYLSSKDTTFKYML